MSWLALLLIGIGLTDIASSLVRRSWLPESVGAVVVVVLGLVGGLTAPGQIVAVVVVAGAVFAWGVLVTRAFGSGPAWPALVVLSASLVGVMAVSGRAEQIGGPLGRWIRGLDLGAALIESPTMTLLLVGAMLVQLSTGNVVVRLVLTATGTTNPMRPHGQVPVALKGGRLLGPMERVFILGLGIAGQITAASIVIAAKGLLRFPELQATRDDKASGRGGGSIHEVTEYFLVGSFVSWMVSLVGLAIVLLAR